LANTLIVFTSDNGYLLGEHRLEAKRFPYEESIRVPFIVRFDSLIGTGGSTRGDLVLNLDLAPTFAAAAGVPAPGVDGMDLLPLLADPQYSWRTDFLVEHLSEGDALPTYCVVRNQTTMYAEYGTYEEELYDLVSDPYQLENLAGDPAYSELKAQMYDRMVQLCSPPPPGFDP
jgi:arylsulfatase A-like enzyme